jgi:hypothetical protein
MSDDINNRIAAFFDELNRDVQERTPEQKAHSAGYTEGYLAAEAEQRRKDGLRAKFSPDDVMTLWQKNVSGQEPLDDKEAVRVWRELALLVEKHHTNGAFLLALNDGLIRELARGERCAVCARYKNPNCATEC